jgi:hypothetical protein
MFKTKNGKGPSKSWFVAAGLTLGAVIWTACGVSAPFSSYDPPPTFAIHYTLNPAVALDYPPAAGTGSSLTGTYVIDVVGTANVTTGTTRSFGPIYVAFAHYLTVDQGRWPAQWNVSSVAGCGAGTGGVADVESKIIEAQCVPKVGSITVNPSSYYCSAPSGYVTLTFESAEVPPGTSGEVYYVDDAGTVFGEETVTVDSNSQALGYSSPQGAGNYYVVADFTNSNLPDGYAGAQGRLNVSGPGGGGYCP